MAVDGLRDSVVDTKETLVDMRDTLTRVSDSFDVP